MSKLNNLKDLFTHLLQDMYFAENKIKAELPKMAEKATNPKLKKGFEKHLEETKDQISKLEKVFEITGIEKDKEKCEAILGLLEEGKGLIKESAEGAVRDSALIAAAQKVEHYEIASYGMLCNMGKLLGYNDAAEILHEILEQEKATDEKLTSMCDEIEEEAMKKAA